MSEEEFTVIQTRNARIIGKKEGDLVTFRTERLCICGKPGGKKELYYYHEECLDEAVKWLVR